jgi:hypothetical protein
MATPIKRIEKDFMLKVLFDEKLPLMLKFGRSEYVLTVDRAPNHGIQFRSNRLVDGARKGTKLELMFDYRGQTVSFSVIVESVNDTLIVCESPEFLYKNLTRSFSRVSTPTDLKAVFSFRGDRYDLAFPKTLEFEPADQPTYSELFNPADIRELIGQLSSWARDAATGHKLVMFRDSKPATTEERLVAETGKSLFIPSTQTDLPSIDPNPKKRIITEEMFKRFLENAGTDPQFTDAATARFLKSKRDAGVYSDLWAPILFQEYVIGYIHLWINAVGKPPFDPSVLDTVYQFAKVLAYSLKVNGYFKSAAVKKDPFPGKVIDVSASGILFANPSASLSTSLLPDSEIELQLTAGKRTVKTVARIMRRYKDVNLYYFGCRYTEIAPEDLRFLFEYLYGKPFTDADSAFSEGKA